MTDHHFASWVSKSGWFDPVERAQFRDVVQRLRLSYTEVDCGTLVATSEVIVGRNHAVTGTILRRGSSDRLLLSDRGDPRDIGATTISLIREYWGDYVAVGQLKSGRERTILRSPFGDLACYWTDCPSHVAAASSVRLLTEFGVDRPAVDWVELERYLATIDLRTGTTCLRGVRELAGGQALHVSQSGLTLERCWSPWEAAGRSKQCATRDAAADQLGAAVLTAVAGRISAQKRAVLLLSGGLDSSVVAAALLAARRSFTCLTMVSPDRLGDERDFARATAAAIGVPLVEIERSLDWITLDQALVPGLPRPTGAQFRAATLGPAAEMAQREGADLIIDGGGGDNMFCSLISVAPVLDHLLTCGPGRPVLATASSLARVAKVGMGDVVRHTTARLASGRVRYRWHADCSMLSRPVAADVPVSHDWLSPPKGVLPGKAAQVGVMLAATAVSETFDSDRHPAIASPLVSQPVAEAALRIPTWMWLEDGRNRASVRRAFSRRLPAMVIDRRSKGTPAGFMSAVVERWRDLLRSQLMDGLLAEHGIIDRAAVDEALRSGPARDYSFARILQLADAEAWARSWSS